MESQVRCQEYTRWTGTHLGQVSPLHWLQDMFTRLRIVDEGIALGAVDDLEVLGAGLAEERFGRHEWGVGRGRLSEQRRR